MNQINSLSDKTFSKLFNLNQLNLKNNKCINKKWEANATMDEIRENLKECDTNYIANATHSKFNEHSTNFYNETTQDAKKFAPSLSGAEAKIDNSTFEFSNIDKLESKITEIEETLSILASNQSAFNETLMAIEEKFHKTVGEMQSSDVKVEQKLDKLEKKIKNLSLNFQLLNKTLEILMKAKRDNDIMETPRK